LTIKSDPQAEVASAIAARNDCRRKRRRGRREDRVEVVERPKVMEAASSANATP